MTATELCAWTAARCAAAACVATVAAAGLLPILRGARSRFPAAVRAGAWVALIAVFLTPTMLIGYAYGDTVALRFARRDAARDLVHAAILSLKFLPVAALVLRFTPRPASDSAIHCHAMLRRGMTPARRIASSIAFWLRTDGRTHAIAAGGVFLLAFTDRELASLLQASSWTVSLFEELLVHVPLAQSLARAAMPAAIQLAVLCAVLAPALRDARRAAATPDAPRAGTPARSPMVILGIIALVTSLAAITAIPLFIACRDAASGVAPMMQNFVLGRDMAYSAAVAFPAALAATLIAGVAARRMLASGLSPASLAAGVTLALPGALGSLVLAFALLSLFRAPLLIKLYGTSGPLLVGLVLLSLPLALLLRVALAARRPRDAEHTADMLAASPDRAVARAGRAIARAFRRAGFGWVVLFLFFWCYLDATAAAVLAPPGNTPVAVTLYNQMHYGKGAVLSAMILTAMVAPLLAAAALALVFTAARTLARRTLYGTHA